MSYETFLHKKHHLTNLNNTDERCIMRKEYDFSKARKNPYAAQLCPITLWLSLKKMGQNGL
jgi:hypothetical protein